MNDFLTYRDRKTKKKIPAIIQQLGSWCTETIAFLSYQNPLVISWTPSTHFLYPLPLVFYSLFFFGLHAP